MNTAQAHLFAEMNFNQALRQPLGEDILTVFRGENENEKRN